MTADIPPVATDDLQFDDAVAATETTPTCAACQQPLIQYYDVNGAAVCPQCVHEAHLQQDRAITFGRVFAAIGLGFIAMLISAAIYFGVAYATGYQYGIVAIVAGLIVGVAVRKASGAVGGWLYQTLAIVLTYLSVGLAMTVGLIHHELTQSPDMSPHTVGVLVLAGIVFPFIAPIAAAAETPFTLLFVGFAIYEAWKINRRTKLAIAGPFHAAPIPQPAAIGVLTAEAHSVDA